LLKQFGGVSKRFHCGFVGLNADAFGFGWVFLAEGDDDVVVW
jgi:hypothetical protein